MVLVQEVQREVREVMALAKKAQLEDMVQGKKVHLEALGDMALAQEAQPEAQEDMVQSKVHLKKVEVMAQPKEFQLEDMVQVKEV